MNNLETFAFIAFFVQIAHSIEELSTGFHQRWYLFKMPFRIFLAFEVCFTLFWAAVLFTKYLPNLFLLQIFLLLMFANGIQHIVWWGYEKKYVPGLVTAFVHIVIFLTFFFQAI